MHDIKWIRDNPDAFDRGLARRGLSESDKKLFSSEQLISIEDRRRAIVRVREKALARRNEASKENNIARKNNDLAAVERLAAEVANLKTDIQRMEAEEKEVIEELRARLSQIPNLPSEEVPDGKDEHANVEHHRYCPNVVHEYTDKEGKPFQPKQHFELGEELRQMDFETAAKLSGARFVVLKSGLARMERAIGQFFIDVHTSEHGYTEIAPPLLVRDEVMYGTAQLPKFKSDQFGTTSFFSRQIIEIEAEVAQLSRQAETLHAEIERLRGRSDFSLRNEIQDLRLREWERTQREIDQLNSRREAILKEHPATSRSLWLIPTAEVPLTNLVRESIVNETDLPMRLTAYTPCFRAEAGAAGKDTRGMIRQHQFNKVELVSITTPEESKNEHERMLSCAEEVLRRLGLHYRVVTLCTGDMGFASQKTYDIEVWLPGQGMYREISSCSNCGDFQARRMNARFRGKENRTPRFVHTLNGSGVAVGRALVAVMENYQQEGGSIAVPDVLQGYMGGKNVIEKAS